MESFPRPLRARGSQASGGEQTEDSVATSLLPITTGEEPFERPPMGRRRVWSRFGSRLEIVSREASETAHRSGVSEAEQKGPGGEDHELARVDHSDGSARNETEGEEEKETDENGADLEEDFDQETSEGYLPRGKKSPSSANASRKVGERKLKTHESDGAFDDTSCAEFVRVVYAKHDAMRKQLIKQNRTKLSEQLLRGMQTRSMLFSDTHIPPNRTHTRSVPNTAVCPSTELILKPTHEVPKGTTWTKVIRSVPVKEQKSLGFSLEEEYDPDNQLTTKEIGTYIGDELDDDYARDESIKELFSTGINQQKICKYLGAISHYARIGPEGPSKRIEKRWLYLKGATTKLKHTIEPIRKPENYMNSIKTHFCIICFTYSCQHHPYMTGYMTNVGHWSGTNHNVLTEALTKPPPTGWTGDEWALLLRGLALYQHTDLSLLKDFVFTKSTQEIADTIERYKLKVEPFPAFPKRPRNMKTGYQVHLLRRNFELDVSENTYIPCTHPGLCKDNECRCPELHHLCTKFCRCSPDCQYRFQGCVCKGDCLAVGCRCYSYGFECDPDLCQCGSKCSAGCMNRQLQRNQEKRLYLAKSNLPNAGWGIFLAEKAEKNELIQEYTGELLPNPESERRGKIYAIIKRNYIFGLTNEHDIDAAHLGSEVRFANHSRRGTCNPRRFFVAGRYRIGIYASRNLQVGDEILFDYDYGEEHRKHYGIRG